ncbi:APC family permease [Actinomadura madurae]|uniref:APC family permease n=1 Tax=Actinomadura madurae TaxID=1993 RepID=UPI0039996589
MDTGKDLSVPPTPADRDVPVPAGAGRGNHGLRRNTLGTSSIVFYIIAAASPLTVVIALFPIMIGAGNGVGLSGAFVLAAAILLLFAVGYVAMSRHITNAGAFYAYVTLGLGRPFGLGSASLAIWAYNAIQVGLYGGFGYYAADLTHSATGVNVPWWLFALAAMAACLALGVHGVHTGARVLGVLMSCETIMIIVLSGAICVDLVRSGTAVTFEPFSPTTTVSAGLGISLMFAHASFIGFEGSAIYGEEARDPRRTVPRATYVAVVFMGLLYAVASWLVVNAVGPQSVVGVAQKESGDFIFAVSNTILGSWATGIFHILILTAIFAAIVTFHNNVARYLFSLGRQNVLWSALGHTRRAKQTPYVACIVQTGIAALVVGAFAVFGLDPFATLFTWMTGVGAIGVILSQTIASLAIFFYFRRTRVDRRLWHTLVAPVLATAGLLTLLYLTLDSLDVLLGVGGWAAFAFVALTFLSLLAGIAGGLLLRRRSPDKYHRLRAALTETVV